VLGSDHHICLWCAVSGYAVGRICCIRTVRFSSVMDSKGISGIGGVIYYVVLVVSVLSEIQILLKS